MATRASMKHTYFMVLLCAAVAAVLSMPTSVKAEPALQGIVTANDGVTPVGDARVSLYNSSGDVITTTDTDSHGKYSLRSVVRGTYLAVARGPTPPLRPIGRSWNSTPSMAYNAGSIAAMQISVLVVAVEQRHLLCSA